MSKLCGVITEEDREAAFQRIRLQHPEWTTVRVRQRAEVEAHILPDPSVSVNTQITPSAGDPQQMELLNELVKTKGYVDCGECPRISTGCFEKCDKVWP